MDLDTLKEREEAELPAEQTPWEYYLERVAWLVETYRLDRAPALHSPSRIDGLTIEEVEDQVIYLENGVRDRQGLAPLRKPQGTVYELE